MCGGGSNKAVKQQQEADAQKQAQIAQGTNAVNAVFDNPQRSTDIAGFTNATKQLLRQNLDDQQVDAQRNTKFALARNGQFGGQVDVDQNANLAKTYNQGLLKVTQAANAAGERVKQSDENSRQSLLGLVQSGLDQNSAAIQAGNLTKSNIASETAAIDPNTVSNAFGDLADYYTNSTTQKAYNDANRTTGALYGNSAAYRGI
jgi:hypothetical protein